MQNERFSVRPLRESDLNEWYRLRRSLWDGSDEQDHKSEMLDIIEHPESQLILIAELDTGRLVGFLEASVRPFVEDCHSDSVGYLEGWYVEPEFRKLGIGRQLVVSAERWARRRGCTEMASDAELGNDVSLSAHLGLGYKETSRLVHLRKELV